MTVVILSGNTSGGMKCPYFNTIISPTLKKVKRFQTEKIDGFFFGNLDPHNSPRLDRNRIVMPKKNVGLKLKFALFGS